MRLTTPCCSPSVRKLLWLPGLLIACLWLPSSLVMLFNVTGSHAQMPPKSSLTPEQLAELEKIFQEFLAAYNKNDFQAAIVLGQKGLKQARDVRAPVYIGRFLNSLGSVNRDLNQNDKALGYYLQALEVRKQVGMALDIASTLYNLGLIHYDLDHKQKALDFFSQALELRRQNSAGPLTIADTLNNMGLVCDALDQYSKALDYYSQALDLYRKNNAGAPDIANVLYGLGALCFRIGQNDRALDYFTQELELDRKNSANPMEIAKALNALGNVYNTLGQHDRALDLLTQSLELDRKRQASPLTIALSLQAIGNVYYALGQNDKALDFYTQTYELERMSSAVPLALASILNNLSIIVHELGQSEKALDYLNQALDLYRKNNGGSLDIAYALHNIGGVYHDIGKNDRAIDYYNQALELYHKHKDSSLEIAYTFNNLGDIYHELGQNDKALDLYTQALDLKRKNNAPPLTIADTLNNIGEDLRALNRLDEAEKQYVESLRLREAAALQVSDPSQVGALQETFKNFYEGYARLLLDRKRPEDALEKLERGRAQGLARQIDLNRSGNISRLFTPEEHKTLDTLTEAFHAALADQRRLAQQAAAAPEGQRAALNARKQQADQEAQQAERNYSLFLDALYARYPDLRRIATGQPALFSELLRMAQDNPDTLYLEYGTVDNTTTLLFALGDKDGLKSLLLPVGAQELRTTVQKWRSALELLGGRGIQADNRNISQKAMAEEKTLAHQVYALLLGDAEKAGLLANGRYRRLVIVGSGPLLDMPPAALLDGQGNRLIERFAVSRALALSVAFWRANPLRPTASLLCIADPTGGEEPPGKSGEKARAAQKPTPAPADAAPHSAPSALRAGFVPLPGARSEGHAVADLFPASRLLIGPHAKEADILKLLPNYALLHFATHGFLVPHAIKDSGLVLAEEPGDSLNDGLLSARKILNLPLAASLAVLSACETGRGQSKGGEGLMGLVWAFRAAGVPAVVASQWQVDDTATRQLMVAFYTELKASKRKDDALRSAMLSVQKEKTSPYYWAAFELIGDPSPLPPEAIGK